jgi:hypothetical protein
MALLAGSPAIAAGSYALVPSGVTTDQRVSIPFTGTIASSGSTGVTGIASTTGLAPGMPVTGTGIPSGTTIGTVASATSITLVYPTGSTPTASGSANLAATPLRAHGTTKVDIGAYEYTDPPTPLDPLATYYLVNLTSDTGASSGTDSTTGDPSGDLLWAITQANANTNTYGSVIEFDPTAFATLQTIGLTSTLQLSETAGPEVIVGPSAGVVISGGNTVRVFKIKSGTTASLSGLTISGGSASGSGQSAYGGGLYNSGTATLDDVIVSGNQTTQDGGGIFTNLGATTTLTQAVVTGNTAAVKGGGIFSEGSTTLNGSSVVSDNSATGNGGGGIYNKNGTTTLSQCTVSGNTAGKGGGGLWTNTSHATTTLSDCHVSGNTAGTIAGGSLANGGGLLTSNGATVALTDCTISGNSTTNGDGGGLHTAYSSFVTLTGCSIYGNSASATLANGGGYGGGVNSTTSTSVLTDCIITGNSANGVGGVSIQGSGTATFTGCTISGNFATKGQVGGLFTGGSPGTPTYTTLSDCTISGNVGAAFGGGVGQNAYGTLTMNYCTISGNFAAFGGGGLSTEGTATLTGCTISGNSTNGTGGGVVTSVGAPHAIPSTTLTNCTVSDNFADHNGGGVADAFSGSSTTLTGCTVSGNTTPGDGGGLFAQTSGSITVNGASGAYSSVSGNYALNGGGVFNGPNSTATLTDVTVSGNAAANLGSGVYNFGTLTLTNVTVTGNSSGNRGSGIWYAGGTSTPTNVTVSGNSANNDVADGVVTPAFSALASPAIVYGTPSVTLTGHLGSGTNDPLLSSVAITLDSVNQDVKVDAWGNFSATFDTSSLGVVDGPYTVTYAFAGNTGFTAVTDTSTALTVTPAPLTVTPDPNQSMTYGDTPSLTFTYTGLVNGDSSAGFTGSLGGATSYSGAGTYAITLGDLAPTGNYTVGTLNAVTLTVNPATLTITADDNGKFYGSTANDFGEVDGVLNNDDITVTLISAGDATTAPVGTGSDTITAALSDPLGALANYTVVETDATLIVYAAPLTVTANVTRVYGAADPAPQVSYSGFVNSDDPGVLGGTLTVVDADPAPSTAVGTYTGAITASGLTSDNYAISYVAGDLSVVSALSVSSIATVSPSPRNSAVSSIDVTFSEPVNLATFTDSALTLTDDGGSNMITSVVTVALVSGSTYQINGLGGLTTANGEYTLTVNSAVIQDQNEIAGTNALSTSWLMDTTAPASHVINSLGTAQTSDSFSVAVTFTDPVGLLSAPASGVSTLELFVSVNNGPFSLNQTMNFAPLASGAATFTFVGQDRNIYAFHAIAIDAAGNFESKSSNAIEASTSVPDLNPPVTHVLSSSPTYSWSPFPSSNFSALTASSYNSTTGVFTLNWAGADPDASSGTPAGSINAVNIYVEIDSATTPTLVGQLSAGAPNGSGVFSGATTYNALADGLPHTYKFFSIGIDDEQKAQAQPSSPDATFSGITFSAALKVLPPVVEQGIAERSFIQYLDVDFNQTTATSAALAGLATELSTSSSSRNCYVELLWYGENLSAGSVPKGSVNLFNTGTTASVGLTGDDLSLNFGANGITSLLTETGVAGTGKASTTFGDGWYALGVDPTGNPSNNQVFWVTFFRLLGDVDGDGVVTGPYTTAGTDAYTVYHAEGQSGPLLNADVDGSGAVNTKDLSYTVAAKGDAVGSTAPANFPAFQLLAGAAGPGNANAITQTEVLALVPEAIEAWREAGLDAADVRRLETARIQVGNLGSSILGVEAANVITINKTAAGFNWFVGAGSPPAGRVDLLTVLEHELGHVVGLADNTQAGDLMDITLGVGVRRAPSGADLAALAQVPGHRVTTAAIDAALPGLFEDRTPGLAAKARRQARIAESSPPHPHGAHASRFAYTLRRTKDPLNGLA